LVRRLSECDVKIMNHGFCLPFDIFKLFSQYILKYSTYNGIYHKHIPYGIYIKFTQTIYQKANKYERYLNSQQNKNNLQNLCCYNLYFINYEY
jgi:hypothetical protein